MNNFIKKTKYALIEENPIFVFFLALCPTLATTTSVSNALGMGISVLLVLTLSNLFISSIRNLVPTSIRIPIYITIIASLVTVIEMFINTFLPTLYDALGIFLPLIVVNCIILGRAEAFASKNKIIPSIIDGITMGLSFTIALVVIATFREVLGTARISLFGITLYSEAHAIPIMTQGAGAFFTLGILAWGFNEYKAKYDKAQKVKKEVIENE